MPLRCFAWVGQTSAFRTKTPVGGKPALAFLALDSYTLGRTENQVMLMAAITMENKIRQ
jgi:hypothetical protein